jgi:hypothetical protein
MPYLHIPHPRHASRRPPKTIEEHHGSGLNGRIAVFITKNVGTMWAAYLFTVIGAAGIFGALTNSVGVVLLVGAVSGYFLQLVLLPIIIVGQNVQAEASDARAEATYKDAEAVLAECLQLQAHLQAQDEILSKITGVPPMKSMRA